jgi:hypothetical protein
MRRMTRAAEMWTLALAFLSSPGCVPEPERLTAPWDAGVDAGQGLPGALGSPCSTGEQCIQGHCSDGVCCDSPCNGQICQRCDSASAAGSGHCGFATSGTDLDHECAPPSTSCSGKCSLQRTLSSCSGTGYTCILRQETVPIPSGQVCSANVAVPVSKDDYCSSGNDCAEGKCEASKWWTSCDGAGRCRGSDDPLDAKIEKVVAASGTALDAQCGSGTAACRAGGGACVSGQCQRYLLTNDTAADFASHLVWQRTLPSQYAEAGASWAEAKTYCAGLSLGGFQSGWRLPTFTELMGIVDASRHNPSIDPEVFPNTPSVAFWTSELTEPATILQVVIVRTVVFDNGTAGSQPAITGSNGTDKARVRCVRG